MCRLPDSAAFSLLCRRADGECLLKSLLDNQEGPLPGDRTHAIKAFASKQFILPAGFHLLLGLTYFASSGTPINYLGGHLLYGTGEGQTSPPGVDGTIPGRSTTLKTPTQRVRVRIGGVEADVLYAGSAPFLVSGVLQVNAKVPAGVTPGVAVPVEVIVLALNANAGR